MNNLNINGTHEQKMKYLTKASSGELIGGMCMSEPGAGTDVLGMGTKASKRGDDWVINGTKMWITNGTVDGVNTGDAFLVYARTGEKRTDLSMFIVEKDMPGFSLGQKIEDKLGMRASMTAELVFEDVVVPEENMVGNLNGAALCMMRNLEVRGSETVNVGSEAVNVGNEAQRSELPDAAAIYDTLTPPTRRFAHRRSRESPLPQCPLESHAVASRRWPSTPCNARPSVPPSETSDRSRR